MRKNKAMDNMHFSEETNIPKACCVCKPKESCTVVHIVILFISKREDHCFNKEVGIQNEVVMARFFVHGRQLKVHSGGGDDENRCCYIA